MHRSDGQGGGGGGGEDEVELAGHVDDEELAERDGGEQAKKSTNDRDGNDATEVVRWALVVLRLARLLPETKSVHGREAGDEGAGNTTSTSGGSLDDGVFLGPERHAQNRGVGQELAENGDDAVTKDGTKEVSTEGEARLQTEVDVGGVDERTQDDADDDGTDGERGSSRAGHP